MVSPHIRAAILILALVFSVILGRSAVHANAKNLTQQPLPENIVHANNTLIGVFNWLTKQEFQPRSQRENCDIFRDEWTVLKAQDIMRTRLHSQLPDLHDARTDLENLIKNHCGTGESGGTRPTSTTTCPPLPESANCINIVWMVVKDSEGIVELTEVELADPSTATILPLAIEYLELEPSERDEYERRESAAQVTEVKTWIADNPDIARTIDPDLDSQFWRSPVLPSPTGIAPTSPTPLMPSPQPTPIPTMPSSELQPETSCVCNWWQVIPWQRNR